ncbi:MAG: hypothetical protein EXR84_02835 [Gammaproteobacteria bacterium]|nr:hypothetical protein [Gammaproteobacteria bacterium]
MSIRPTIKHAVFAVMLALPGIPQLLLAADTTEAIRQQFIGDYELLSYIQFLEQGGEIDMNYIGRLSYDAFGNMSGLGMLRDLPERQQQSSERLTGGFAYWGKVSYNLELQQVIHHVTGSPMIPAWVGGDNIRYFEFDGDLLKLSLKNAQGRVTGTLTWRRLQ